MAKASYSVANRARSAEGGMISREDVNALKNNLDKLVR